MNTTMNPTIEEKTDTIFEEMEPYPVVPVPYDEEGYIKSFNIDEEDEYMNFFNEFGFVVIDNIIDQESVKATINEIWDDLESELWTYDRIKVDRNDSETWEYFPRSQVGIVGNDPCIGFQAWRNRQNPNIYRAFSKIMGREELWVSMDRYGMMRPTKDIPVGKLEPVEVRNQVKDIQNLPLKNFDKWKTAPLWLHWDLNPYLWTSGEGAEYEFVDFIVENNDTKFDGNIKLQGLVNLVDSTEDDGGFCTVPGFHKYLKDWTTKTKDTIYAEKKETCILCYYSRK